MEEMDSESMNELPKFVGIQDGGRVLARPLIREIFREIDITIDEYNKILDKI